MSSPESITSGSLSSLGSLCSSKLSSDSGLPVTDFSISIRINSATIISDSFTVTVSSSTTPSMPDSKFGAKKRFKSSLILLAGDSKMSFPQSFLFKPPHPVNEFRSNGFISKPFKIRFLNRDIFLNTFFVLKWINQKVKFGTQVLYRRLGASRQSRVTVRRRWISDYIQDKLKSLKPFMRFVVCCSVST